MNKIDIILKIVDILVYCGIASFIWTVIEFFLVLLADHIFNVWSVISTFAFFILALVLFWTTVEVENKRIEREKVS